MRKMCREVSQKDYFVGMTCVCTIRKEHNWMKRTWRVLFLLLLAAVFTGCQVKSDYSQSGIYFDTLISIHVYDTADKTVVNDCLILCEEYEKKLSKNIDNSDIYRINHAKGQWVQVSEETAALITQALNYSELSQGAFDITIASVSELWHVTDNDGIVPKAQEIDRALKLVDYHMVQVENDKVRLSNPQAEIDLGGIAKGYIGDKLKEFLLKRGITSAKIDLGGNIVVIGSKKDGSAWNIGIQEPFAEAGQVIGSVKLQDKTMVTSGIYQRYFKLEDMIYHHIMDPVTGKPSDSDVSSVTIIGTSSTEADALSTCCLLMGSEQGVRLIEEMENVEAVFITRDGEVLASSGIDVSLLYGEQ